ncbi:MAG TPA: response regulator [Candidatus Pelethocola excrementipullorum]|nr:response regulator [Candidatus Pelethocola excrementipullorum]
MTKILLVDDEDFIRQGMLYTIPWEENDLEVMEASTGQEALDLAIRIKPDIVLADIQMPVMSGLELARRLGTLLPETRVIILTAYGNTDNLINAIDVKVSAFLVKSADGKKILDTVLKVKKELDTEKSQNQKLNKIQGIYNENQVLIKSTLVSRFLKTQISFSHFSRKMEDLGVDLSHAPLGLAVIRCNSSDEKYVIGQFLQYFQDYSPICFFIQNQMPVLLLDTSQTPLDDGMLDHLLPSIQPVVFGNFIAVMNSIQSYEYLPMAYRILLQALEHCFWNDTTPYTLLTPRDQIFRETKIVPYTYEREIIQSIVARKQAEFSQALYDYYHFMKDNKVSRQIFLDSIIRLMVLISSVQEEELDIPKLKELVEETETPKEILDLVGSLTFPSTHDVSSHTQINLALAYIGEHFTEDLYLEDVAKEVYLSPGYLCRIFKSETGYSFKEYIHKLRIEKAQEMIRESDYKYYEIAEKVGYKNYKYFSSYFNKITGCSAKEYRIANL